MIYSKPLSASAFAAQELQSIPTQARPHGPVRCREITPADFAAVAALLHRGFPRIPAQEFVAALHRSAARPRLPDMPHIGLALMHEGAPVGVLLTIASQVPQNNGVGLRCNLACWHVDPVFRIYAPLLVLRLGNKKNVTYINISPARETLSIIEAQGFKRFSLGGFAGVPALAMTGNTAKILPASKVNRGNARISPTEWAVLDDHAADGGISMVCSNAAADLPLVFRRRSIFGMPLTCAHLVYCRDIADIEQHAGAIGRYLARRGLFWILVSASSPLKNVVGKFYPAKLPMYYRGQNTPRPGDLAYTEAALFGF